MAQKVVSGDVQRPAVGKSPSFPAQSWVCGSRGGLAGGDGSHAEPPTGRGDPSPVCHAISPRTGFWSPIPTQLLCPGPCLQGQLQKRLLSVRRSEGEAEGC